MEKQKPNHVCKVCGAEYYACDICEKHDTYKVVCESENHYKIYNIAVMFVRGVYTKSEALKALDKCDLSDIDSYKESIKNIILDIQAKPKSRKKTEVVEVAAIIEPEPELAEEVSYVPEVEMCNEEDIVAEDIES